MFVLISFGVLAFFFDIFVFCFVQLRKIIFIYVDCFDLCIVQYKKKIILVPSK